MRNPSARAVEAAATEEILLRLETEVDRRFQVVDTKLALICAGDNGNAVPSARSREGSEGDREAEIPLLPVKRTLEDDVRGM